MWDDMAKGLHDTGLKFAHFAWSKAPTGDYGVYGEDGANMLRASDRLSESVVEGTVDWFTRNPNSSAPATIQAVFDNLPCAWYLNSIQYEEDTGYIHYEWVVQA